MIAHVIPHKINDTDLLNPNGQGKTETQLQVIGRLMQQNNVTVIIDTAGETTVA